MRRFLVLAAALVALPALAQTDGRLHDQGHALTDRSPRADGRLDAARPLLGTWDVAVTTFPTDTTTHTATGQAEITYMNRGYALMERRIVEDAVPGRTDHALSFLVFSPGPDRWALGEGRSETEHIEVYDGVAEAGGLALRTAVRRGGGTLLTYERVRYAMADDGLTVTVETSTDDGATWAPHERRSYTRRAAAPLLAVRADDGVPAEGLPAEARQFDFLLGVWDAQHQITLPTGQQVAFPTTTTASIALGGHGLLEHSWFDLDPTLPDAATTILRLYNRAERRWESLYLTNRVNTLLDFGGAWEGDRMVLHPFDTHLGGTISRFVFYDIEPDRYLWLAESSTDRGETFTTTWTIDVTRR
ncbi:MAG: hypothetical protein CMM85_08555 [Rhodothermaceae bacterium]|nr:hypothetical protein [Rhodothermaceae bacterium]